MHIAQVKFAEAAAGSFRKKTDSDDSQGGDEYYAIVSNGSPERKENHRDPSQYSGLQQLDDLFEGSSQNHCDSPHDTQSYRDFAAGGHVESDKKLAAMMEREAAEARGKQLDEENFAALFSDPVDAVVVDMSKKMTLVRTLSNGKGGRRGVWKGTYRPPRSKNASPSKKEEASLLDL